MTVVQAAAVLAWLLLLCGVWIAACPLERRRGRHTIRHRGVAAEIHAVIVDMNRHTRERDNEACSDTGGNCRRGGCGGRHRVASVSI